jgi:diguanylate cyclase (GGDEF)-like protein
LYGAGAVLTVVLIGVMFVMERRARRLRSEASTFRRVATTDPLTGLGNVRGFEEALQAIGPASHTMSLSLLMMDLDGFKLVNDSYGHARGDELLKAFASVVAEMAPPGSGRFRIGGDEFALLLHGHAVESALAVAQRIRAAAEEHLGHGVTVSLGAAAVRVSADFDPALLRQKADAALYTAKLNGRNVALAYEADEVQHPLFPTAKLRAVRELLVEGRIEPVFQPIWDLGSRRLLGYEGLSRPHRDYGLDGPQEAFEIAEHFGHAAELDLLCRRHILAAAGTLASDGVVFINVSPYSLANHAFSAQLLLDELAAAGLAPSRVVFEITEQSRVSIDVVASALRELAAAGLRIALDDVGAGNNGLMLLSRVPFDFVKIDRSVIVSATDGGPGRGALMAILAFAAESGAHVVAEGVEDSAMFAVVQEFAGKQIKGNPGLIHGVQGFYLGRPQPAATIERDGAPGYPPSPDTDIAAA